MTKTKVLFTDGCYQAKTVKAINRALNSGTTAVATWEACREALQKNEGEDGFDTAPREFILGLIIEELKLENWEALAGLVGWGRYSNTRPELWNGVDAQEHFDGGCPIDWYWIEITAENNDYDPCAIYSIWMDIAMDCNKKGDKKGCSFYASNALAALNHYVAN